MRQQTRDTICLVVACAAVGFFLGVACTFITYFLLEVCHG